MSVDFATFCTGNRKAPHALILKQQVKKESFTACLAAYDTYHET